MIPDLSVVWVVLIILVLATVLNRLLFKPLAGVMREREDAIKSARQVAEGVAAQARQASTQFDERTKAARGELHRTMDDRRRAALEMRAALLADARREAEALIAGAAARLQAQGAEARRILDQDADSLASAVTERVLGRRAS